jgi:hypothetical protein
MSYISSKYYTVSYMPQLKHMLTTTRVMSVQKLEYIYCIPTLCPMNDNIHSILQRLCLNVHIS